MGYAFINVKEKEDIFKFYYTFNFKKWELFKSKKVIFIFIRFVKLNMQEFKAKLNLKDILIILTLQTVKLINICFHRLNLILYKI